MDRECLNFKCYSVHKRCFGLITMQHVKKALIKDIPYLMEAFMSMEAQYRGDIDEQQGFNYCHGPV